MKLKSLEKNKLVIIIGFITMILLMAFGFSGGLPKSHQKKILKELNVIWPENSILLSDFPINNVEAANQIGIESIYRIIEKEDSIGYLVYLKVPSKFDTFDLAIFYDSTIHIKSMKVLAYREDHGAEVGSKRWLKQFIGMGIHDSISLNDDIQGISGATISCESATKGAHDATLFLNNLIIKE